MYFVEMKEAQIYTRTNERVNMSHQTPIAKHINHRYDARYDARSHYFDSFYLKSFRV